MGLAHSPSIVMNGLVLALDAANKKSYSQNEFQYSTDIFGWCGASGHYAATISRDTISSPVGNTPLKMAVTGNDPHIGTYNTSTWNIAPAANGQTWVVSVYVKANVATTGEIVLFGANSSGTAFVGVDWLAISGVTVNITTEWTRVSHYITMANANIAFIHTRLDGPNTGGTGQTVWWDGLQVERVPAGTTTPTPFISSYYGGNVYRDLIGTNNGTLINYPTYSSANGGTFSFDGTDEYTNHSPVLSSGQQRYTISAWWKTSVNNRIQVVWEQNSSAGTTNTRAALLFVNANWGFNGQSNDAHDKVPVRVNQWTNGVITIDTTLGTNPVKIYENGSLYWEGNTSGSASILNVGNFASGLGRKIPSNNEYFIGSISQVQIYNRVLTAAEIQQNFNALRGRFGI
jgi:hypothetical protein